MKCPGCGKEYEDRTIVFNGELISQRIKCYCGLTIVTEGRNG